MCVDVEAYTTYCSFQTVWKGFGLGRWICQKRYVIDVVIVCAGYLSLLSFASLNPFSLIRSTDVKQVLGKCVSLLHTCYNFNVVCFHLVSGHLLSCFYIVSLWLRQFLWGKSSARSIGPIFSLCMEFTNNRVASRFFVRTPSRIRRIVKICHVVNRFHRKPFWFFLSIFSILGSMQLRCRAL